MLEEGELGTIETTAGGTTRDLQKVKDITENLPEVQLKRLSASSTDRS